jgi:hypothetical protein
VKVQELMVLTSYKEVYKHGYFVTVEETIHPHETFYLNATELMEFRR